MIIHLLLPGELNFVQNHSLLSWHGECTWGHILCEFWLAMMIADRLAANQSHPPKTQTIVLFVMVNLHWMTLSSQFNLRHQCMQTLKAVKISEYYADFWDLFGGVPVGFESSYFAWIYLRNMSTCIQKK